MSSPSVSILVPFYNAEHFLAEAIASVFTQTFSDWELLLIDDGSTDKSRELASEIASRNPARVFPLRHSDNQNHGLPATRNLGLSRARGEFIALLDSDDFWFPAKLLEQVSILRQFPEAAMVFGRSEYWHSWDPQSREDDTVPELAPARDLYDPPELWKLCYPFGSCGAPCPSDLLLRKSICEEVGGFEESFDERSPTHEDIAFLSKVFLRYPVSVSHRCWDRYRRHDESLWAKAQQDGGEERSRAFFFAWMERYLRASDIKDESVWEQYRARSWRYRHHLLAGALDGARSALRPVKRWVSKA